MLQTAPVKPREAIPLSSPQRSDPLQGQLDRENERIPITENRHSRELDLSWLDRDKHDEAGVR